MGYEYKEKLIYPKIHAQKKITPEHDKVTAAEMTLTYHGVKHHHLYN